MRITLVSSLVLAIALSGASPGRADVPDAHRAEAAERFDRAIRLVNAGDLSGALAEFLRAYALVPAPVVQYNVGLVYSVLNRPVDAAHSLERALSSVESLKPEDAQRARSVLREQSEKIGQVEVTTNVKEGVVEVDNVEVAKLPLRGPLDVAVGSHIVGVIAAGYAPARREIVVAGRAQARAHLEVLLVAIDGLLAHIAVHSRVPAADVVVDDERVGKTPLDTTVTTTPGKHRVELRRAGYTPAAREIVLGDGAREDLTLDPAVDTTALAREGGWLAIAASETQAVVSVDGQEIGLLQGPIRCPAGPHRLHVERGGFNAAERDIDVPLGGTRNIAIVFEPTPETRARFVSGAQTRRTWSWVTLGIGTALTAAGVSLALVEQNDLGSARVALDQAEAQFQPGGTCDMRGVVADPAGCRASVNDAAARVDQLAFIRTVGWVAAGVGGAVMVTGAVLLFAGEDPHKYDERPTDRWLAHWRLMPELGLGRSFLSVAARF